MHIFNCTTFRILSLLPPLNSESIAGGEWLDGYESTLKVLSGVELSLRPMSTRYGEYMPPCRSSHLFFMFFSAGRVAKAGNSNVNGRRSKDTGVFSSVNRRFSRGRKFSAMNENRTDPPFLRAMFNTHCAQEHKGLNVFIRR
jgi:hypothetical protein